MATGEKGKKSIKHVPLPIPKKKLPDAVRTIPAACDHAIVELSLPAQNVSLSRMIDNQQGRRK